MDCFHSQPPVRTSLLVRAAGYLPDISASCPQSRVSPSVYWRFNFGTVGALSAFSLWAPFPNLRNKMRAAPKLLTKHRRVWAATADDWTWFLEKAERDALFRPVGWNIALHQVGRGAEPAGCLEDGLQWRGEIRQLDHAVDIGSRTSIRASSSSDRRHAQALAQVACLAIAFTRDRSTRADAPSRGQSDVPPHLRWLSRCASLRTVRHP